MHTEADKEPFGAHPACHQSLLLIVQKVLRPWRQSAVDEEHVISPFGSSMDVERKRQMNPTL